MIRTIYFATGLCLGMCALGARDGDNTILAFGAIGFVSGTFIMALDLGLIFIRPTRESAEKRVAASDGEGE